MWSESVNEENLDIRLWPRLAAIAERFWSPQEVRDTADMHRRLAITEQRLHDQGLNQRRALQTYLASLTGGTLSAEMENLAAIATPVAFNNLMSWRGMASMMLPNWLARHIDPPDLNTFSNMIPVDSPAARQFDALVDEFLANPQQSKAGEIRRSLIQWSILNNALAETFSAYPQIDNLKPLAETVTQVANAGLLALAAMENDESVAPADIGKGLELLQSLALFNMENFEKDLRKRAFSWKPLILKQTDIAVVPAVEKLVRAALDEVL
jgi:hexosaminidase